MGQELQPLGDKAWMDCRQTTCGNVTWCAGWTTKPTPIANMRSLVSLRVTDLKAGDGVELTISGAVRGTYQFKYYVHPDPAYANQPEELHSQSWREAASSGNQPAVQALHGVAVYRVLKDVNSQSAPTALVFTWYLEGEGTVDVGYTVTARNLGQLPLTAGE